MQLYIDQRGIVHTHNVPDARYAILEHEGERVLFVNPNEWDADTINGESEPGDIYQAFRCLQEALWNTFEGIAQFADALEIGQ